MDKTLLITLFVFLLIVISYLLGRLHKGKKADLSTQDTLTLYNELQSMPSKVLAAIQGSINPQKGKMAELLTYAQIRYDYDVIIPLGQPIDFIGIKKGEKIDFIEVKSGQAQVLTPTEAEIQKLVKNGKVNFRLLVVKDSEMHQESQ
jgi:hypothetical protein